MPNFSAKKPAVSLDDDEDVDDLDGVLDEFSKPSAPKPTAWATQPSVLSGGGATHQDPSEPTDAELAAIEAEFAKELQAGMEALMKDFSTAGSSAGTAPTNTADPGDEEQRQLQEAFQKMLLDGAPEAEAPTRTGASPSPGTRDFHTTIKEAVDRLKASDENAKAASTDPLAQLLASLGDLGDLEGDLGDDEQMQGLLENMMSQLLSKELLYEPLKELDEKYPEYFVHNSSSLSTEDLEKYRKQQVLIGKTVKLYEDPAYSDTDPNKSTAVLDLMQEIQALGPPPKEIMGDLPPGLTMGSDGMPNLEGMEGCTIL